MKREDGLNRADHATVRERGWLQRELEVLEEGLVVLRGESTMTVRGCRRILLYSNTLIRLRMRRRVLCVEGSALCCTSFSGGVIMLAGRIVSVRYEGCGEECRQ